MRPSVWLATLLLPGLLLAGCRQQSQPAWLTPVRTVAPQAAVLPTAAAFPSAASPTAGTTPTTPLPTPPPLPFSPLKDGAYMYQPVSETPVRLWGAWGGYYRLPEAPNVIIYLLQTGTYYDHPPQMEFISISFFFKIYGLTPPQLERTFPLHPTSLGTFTSRFIYGIQDLRLADGTSVLPGTFFYVATNKSGWGKNRNIFSTPEPGTFAALEEVNISPSKDHFLRGGALWHGHKTMDFLLELEMAPGFHLKAPLRLWVPIAYYNGPPP